MKQPPKNTCQNFLTPQNREFPSTKYTLHLPVTLNPEYPPSPGPHSLGLKQTNPEASEMITRVLSFLATKIGRGICCPV